MDCSNGSLLVGKKFSGCCPSLLVLIAVVVLVVVANPIVSGFNCGFNMVQFSSNDGIITCPKPQNVVLKQSATFLTVVDCGWRFLPTIVLRLKNCRDHDTATSIS